MTENKQRTAADYMIEAKNELASKTAPAAELMWWMAGADVLVELDIAASEAGYASLHDLCDSSGFSSALTREIVEYLCPVLAMVRAEADGLGPWDDLDAFLDEANNGGKRR